MADKKRNTTFIRRDDKNFRRDVSKAKMQYRKKRAYIILSICIIVLSATLIRTYFFSKEKAQLENTLQEQEQQIVNLEKENKTNEVIINKLRDPYFITDLVRQEYGMSYSGELIFNLPLKENYMQNAINSIMAENPDKNLERTDQSKLIVDENIAELIRLKQEEEKRKEEEAARKERASNTRSRTSSTSNSSTATQNTTNNSQTNTTANQTTSSTTNNGG